MPQWEYEKISLNDAPAKVDDVVLLDEVGKDGWELVTIAVNGIAYFKRALAGPDAPKPAAPRKPRRA